MTERERQDPTLRVLVLSPTRKDAALTRSVLARAGIACMCCAVLDELCGELDRGVGAVVLPEEALAPDRAGELERWLDHQPPWSDLPLLVLVRPGEESAGVVHAVDALRNITVLERPARVGALVSAVRTALRARQRQYQIRDELEKRERHQRTQALLAAIVESSDDAIISKTLQGRILTWNAGAERLYGYSAAEAIGQSVTLLIPSERLDEEPALLERLRRGERIEHYETVRLRKDGSRVDISLTVSPIRNAEGRIIAASKVARDITETKRAARDLRAAQEQLKLVTDNMAAVVFHCGRDLRYRWVSPGGAAFLNRPAEEIVDKHIEEVVGTPALETIRPHIERVLAGERVEFEANVPYRARGPRWVRAVYVPTYDPAGRTDGWVAVITDTTAHHQMEEALREADRRKDEFLAVLAHELRNPLAPIYNSLHILRILGQRDPEATQVLEILERQVTYMVRLVDDLLEVSRITRGKIELRLETIDLVDMLKRVVEENRPLVEACGHALDLEVPSEPLTLEGDSVRLAQVFANLLNNAAKYTDAGGRVTVSVKPQGDEVVVSVRDTGIGMLPGEIPHVFELFTQLDRDGNRAKGGLGIGLTLVKKLVELHHGSVQAHSEGPGRGSEFVVRLPLAGHGADLAPPPAAPARGALPHRVLVVDDNQDAARSLALLLGLRGVEVQATFSAAEALGVLETFMPDVVLLDIGMPEMDGLELARHIRHRPELQHVTLVALTGWGQEYDRRRSRSAGFDHHMIKPADIDALEALLASLQVSRG